MFQLPDEIWNYIKDFIFDWKRSHKYKMNSILLDLIKILMKKYIIDGHIFHHGLTQMILLQLNIYKG